jgi:hypothetical protein
LTKLDDENRIDWDEHLPIVLFSYKTTYKVAIGYTSYQLVYGLHPLMPTEYIILVAGGNERDNTSVRVLISRIIKLEKLQKAKMQAVETVGI